MQTNADLFKNYNETEFISKALDIFTYQSEHNLVYRRFLDLLGTDVSKVDRLEKIPFLPIRFFKNFEVLSSAQPIEKTFTSSGTTGTQTSRHLVTDLSLYHHSLKEGFSYFYGDISDYTILALLPSYLERSGSSLIDMVDFWMQKSQQKDNGYFLYNHEELFQKMKRLESENKPVILIGVTFALLDFAEKYKGEFAQTILIETGGMKGRKEELTRIELHEILKQSFNKLEIHSEYGMTELLSQAYAKNSAVFQTPPWMRVMIRETDDPFTIVEGQKSGGINVIDFANINSCAFIATDDLGKMHAINQFEIMGRFDNADVRGCNLLVI